jgi:hypothetical protein
MTDPEQREQQDSRTRMMCRLVHHPAEAPLRSFGWVNPSPASSKGGAVTATKLGHPIRLAYPSDAMSASLDP